MRLIQAKNLIRKLKREGANASLYIDYSGRFMFGSKTYGVVTNSAGDYEMRHKYRRDNLGLDYIFY